MVAVEIATAIETTNKSGIFFAVLAMSLARLECRVFSLTKFQPMSGFLGVEVTLWSAILKSEINVAIGTKHHQQLEAIGTCNRKSRLGGTWDRRNAAT